MNNKFQLVSERTLELSKQWNEMEGVDVNMHITCTNMPVEKLEESLTEAAEAGVDNLVCLRGDPPVVNGEEAWQAVEGGFKCGLDLVKYVREKWGNRFCISVAGYPEGHTDQIDEVDGREFTGMAFCERERVRRDPETGEMIDEATAKIALMRVSKAYLAGLVDKEYLDLMAEKSKSITGYDILGSSD